MSSVGLSQCVVAKTNPAAFYTIWWKTVIRILVEIYRHLLEKLRLSFGIVDTSRQIMSIWPDIYFANLYRETLGILTSYDYLGYNKKKDGHCWQGILGIYE